MDRLNLIAAKIFAEAGVPMPVRSQPRTRYWTHQGKRYRYTFEYTTQTADQGKYWAVVYRWTKGGQGKLVKRSGFRQRNKAKAKAYDWYQKAKGA